MARKQVVTSVNTLEEQSCFCCNLQTWHRWHIEETGLCPWSKRTRAKKRSVSTLRDAQLSVLTSHLWHQPLDSAAICACASKQSVLLIDSCILDTVNPSNAATEIGREKMWISKHRHKSPRWTWHHPKHISDKAAALRCLIFLKIIHPQPLYLLNLTPGMFFFHL